MRNRASPRDKRISQTSHFSDSSSSRRLSYIANEIFARLRTLPHAIGRALGLRQHTPSHLFAALQACIACCVLWLVFSAAFLNRTISSGQGQNHKTLHINIQRRSDFRPNWRNDSRCGRDFSPPDGGRISVCDPFARACCCSGWGWCGEGPGFCTSALVDPHNHTALSGMGLKVTSRPIYAP